MSIDDDYIAYCFDEVCYFYLAECTDEKGKVNWNKIKWIDKKADNNDFINFVKKPMR